MARKPDPIEKLPKRVRQLRFEAGLSQSMLAKISNLDRTTVSKAENGLAVSEETILRLQNVLSEVLGRTVNLRE